MDSIARGVAVAARNRANLLAATRKLWLPQRIRTQEVMASPPTIAVSTTNALSAGRFYPSLSASGSNYRINPLFRYRKGGAPILAGTSFPDWTLARFTSTNYGPTTGQICNLIGIPFMFPGTDINYQIKGGGQNLFVKVNGQYASLTPTALPNDGALQYVQLTFGSAALREIELIAAGSIKFGGVYTSVSSDTLYPAAPRGPRTIVLWDSFGEGTGAANEALIATNIMADCLVWDDVRPSAVGATGLIQISGDKLNYNQRLATDVLPFAPDLLIVVTSINDAFQTPAAMTTAMQSLISTVKGSLPNCQIVFTSMMANKGSGNLAANYHNVTDAMAALAASGGFPFINLLDQPLPEWFTTGAAMATPTTLAASAALSATTLSTVAIVSAGASYKFADGTHVYVKSVSGSGPFTATIDNLSTAQSSGATLTPCGNSIWSGAGKVGATTGFGNCDVVVGSDGTHPTPIGHQMLGAALGYGLMQALA